MKGIVAGLMGLTLLVICAPALGGVAAVTEAVVSTDVVDRSPKGISNQFPSSVGRLYFFTKVEGLAAGSRVVHRWKRGGKTEFELALDIGGPSWRVWSAKTIGPGHAGRWTVEVVDDGGGVLRSLEFDVVP